MTNYPSNIPAGGVWDAAENCWTIGQLVNGKREGKYRSYRPDGTLCRENHFLNGRSHGHATRYHENGEVAQTGEMVDGQRNGLWQWFRSTGETTEQTLPPGSADNIWGALRMFRHGHAGPSFFCNRNEELVLEDGSPYPERPASVPQGTAYYPPENCWYFGLIIANDQPNHRIGLWQWWNADGKLIRERDYNLAGAEIEDKAYLPDGTPRHHFKKDQHGNRILEARYDQGKLQYKIERSFEKKTLTGIRIHNCNNLLQLVGTLNTSGGLDCQFYDNGGLLEAKGAFNDEQAPTGTWQFYDASGTMIHEFTVDHIEWEGFRINQDFNTDWVLSELLLRNLAGSPLPPALKEVDDIDWNSLEACYSRKLHHFPLYFRGLFSTEGSVQVTALSEIQSETLHQGSLYEATARVMPFLLAALDQPGIDTAPLLHFIRHIADTTFTYREEAAKYLEKDPDMEAKEWPKVIMTIAAALEAGWPVIKSLIQHTDSNICHTALQIAQGISSPEVVETIIPLLQSAQTATRHTALYVMLHRPSETTLNPGEIYAHKDPLVQLVAAIHWGIQKGPGAPDGTVTILSAVWREKDSSLFADYMALPFVTEDIRALLCLALGCIRNEEARQLLPELCSSIDDLPALDAVTYGRGLLALALGNGQLPYAPHFTLALSTLANSRQFFTYINCNDVLNDWRLPTSPDALLQLANRINESEDPEATMHRFIFEGV